MRTRINTRQLATALAAVKPAVSPTRPFVRLTPTDHGTDVEADNLDLGVRASVESWNPMDAKEDEGPVGVPFKPLADLLNHTDAEDVELFEFADEVLQIRAGRTDMSLPLVDMDWFPRRAPAEGTAIELTAEDWSFVQTIVPFASTEDASGVYAGVWFGPFGVAATDKWHLGCWKHSFEQTAVVPGEVLTALRSDGAVTITVGEKAVTVVTDSGLSVTTATIQGEPVDYQRAMATPTARLTVERAAFKEAMARVAISSRPSFTNGRQMRLESIDANSIRLTSLPGEKTDGEVTEVFDCEVDGEIEPLGIDSRLLSNCIDLVGTDEVTIGCAGPGKAMSVVTDMIESFFQPVRLTL